MGPLLNPIHPKIDRDRRAEPDNDLNHQEAQISATNYKAGP